MTEEIKLFKNERGDVCLYDSLLGRVYTGCLYYDVGTIDIKVGDRVCDDVVASIYNIVDYEPGIYPLMRDFNNSNFARRISMIS